jgi:Tfp pilus assembly protein PilF
LSGRLREVFSFLPKGTEFRIHGDNVTVSVPAISPNNRAEAERLAEKAAQRAQRGEYGRAKDVLHRVLQLDPSFISARRDLAMICVETGDLDEAKNHLIEVLRLNPTDAWAYVILANHYTKHEDDKETAEKFLRKALELKPDDTWAMNSLGAVMVEKDQPEEAMRLFDRAILVDKAFANSYFGKALLYTNQEKFPEAAEALEGMFMNGKVQDTRSNSMFKQARDSYFRVENIIANNKKAEGHEVIRSLTAETEKESGYPVVVERGPLPGSTAAQVKMAWKHNADHHTLIVRDGEMPEILKTHFTAHELHHVLMESAARDAGANRWFATSSETRRKAILSIRKDIQRLEKKGYDQEAVIGVINELLSGASAFLFNCSLDMQIERNIRQNFPALREAQFCGVFALAQEALQTRFGNKLPDVIPQKILEISDSLNGAYALFIDELFEGATAFAAEYQKLPTFHTSRELYQLWKERVEGIQPGQEYDIIDAFAEKLHVRDWYIWKEDKGFQPDPDINTEVTEGTTNPELLKAKAPAAVFYFLAVLRRFEELSPRKVKEITLEIALLGREGLDYSSADKKYTLRTLPGERFGGLELMCLMYVGFKQIDPDVDPSIKLHDEYKQALQLFKAEMK